MFFSFLQISEACSLKSIHKPIQFCVVKEIRWKLHCQVVTTHVLGIIIAGEVEGKEELKNLLIWGNFSFHVVVDREIFI